MSYIRSGSPYTYVEGFSDAYIFPSGCIVEGEKMEWIEDYDKVSNDALVELIGRWLKDDDFGIKEYLLEHLAERLDVKLRDKFLTNSQSFDLMIQHHNEWLKTQDDATKKRHDEWLKKKEKQ